MSAFWQLLKKDWRLNRAPMIALWFAVIGPYLFSIFTFSGAGVHSASVENYLREDARYSAQLGLTFLALVAAAFGGNAFATERKERWADFLTTLPVSRWQVVLSKLLVVFVPLLVGWGIQHAVLTHYWGLLTNSDVGTFIETSACAILGMFSFAWCLSILLPSAAISASAAIGIVWATVTTVDAMHGTNNDSPDSFSLAFIWFPGVLLAIIFSDYYVRRVAP